jgi:zinc transporter 9
MSHSSRKAVLTAIVSNSIVTVIKFIAATFSGSASMMNESVHSLMDTLNQGFLLLGLREANRPADKTYAFGHGQKKYLWNLWSAIGLFSIGAGLGLSHAWHSWQKLGQTEAAAPIQLFDFSIDPLWLNLVVLAIAFLLEGYSFLVAFKQFLLEMREDGFSNPFSYLTKSDDPTLVAVVLEDSVAMIGLMFAASGIGLTAITGHGEWDILFSALIALMLALIAFYLGYVNMRYLSDMRDPAAEVLFERVINNHKQVERHHDLRSIILDENHTILVAEIELREEALVPRLQQEFVSQRDNILAQVPVSRRDQPQVRSYASARASVEVTMKHAEQIIDEIETEIKAQMPRITHITLEIEGIYQPDAATLFV